MQLKENRRECTIGDLKHNPVEHKMFEIYNQSTEYKVVNYDFSVEIIDN